MKSNEILISHNQNSPVDYYNAVGLIYDNSIYINKKDCLVRLELSLIRNIYFKKEKALTSNIFLLSIGLFLIAMLALTDKIIPLDFKVIGYSTAVVAVLLAFLIKFNNYKIIITTINNNIITTNINSEYCEDGLELVTRIRNNINKENSLIRAV
ncbi:hypothetical protein IVB69_11955 [Flavobacterium sp. J49]|uniref:hypothetical protein n=1 Tax=Flavobacterium sp. J49 TaxID=2718534 RepID=UPI001592EACD|nr:hypothetical protein [Flavobacterium sp. J49]MBF6642198.1 hypothetical protein [Flavobacterium sp. J49]NIC03445.1 hypothetical protein [Flavobacterium sp. J49]